MKMAQYSLSPCKTEDLQSLWETVFGDSRSVTQAFFADAFFPDGCFYVEADGKAVAALYLLPVNTGNLNGFYLYAAATLPAWRGQGIMGNLIREALTFAKGCSDFVYLCPAEDSLYAYYERFGFSQTLYAACFENADTEEIVGAGAMYEYASAQENCPHFMSSVYRYADRIGCRMYLKKGTEFADRVMYPVGRADAKYKKVPYGTAVLFNGSRLPADWFAFLTMN